MDEDAETLRAIDDEIRALEAEEERLLRLRETEGEEDELNEETDEFYEYQRSSMTGAYFKSQHPEQYQRMVMEHQAALAQQSALEEARRRAAAAYVPALQTPYMPPMMYMYPPNAAGFYPQQQQAPPMLQFPAPQLLGAPAYAPALLPPGPAYPAAPPSTRRLSVESRPRRLSTDGQGAPSHPQRPRGASQTVLDEIQLRAQTEVLGASARKADLFTVIRATAVFVLAMFGESLFVMVRDWLDGSSSRKAQTSQILTSENAMMEEAFAAAAVEVLESEQRKNGGPAPTREQKIFRAKSVRKLAQAKSVREMIKGLVNTGRNAEATALASSALAMRRRMYGDAHPATANAWNQLAAALSQEGDYEQAEEAYKDALRVVRRAFPESNPREAKVLHNLGVIRLIRAQEAKRAGDADGARRWKEEARENGSEALRIMELAHEKSKSGLLPLPTRKLAHRRLDKTRAHLQRVWGEQQAAAAPAEA